MNKNENISNQVERYLNDEMSTEERLAFDQELKSNSSLQSELVLQQTIQAAVIDNAILDFQNAFQQERVSQATKRRVIRITAIAIGVIGLSLVGFWLAPSQRKSPIPDAPSKKTSTESKKRSELHTGETTSTIDLTAEGHAIVQSDSIKPQPQPRTQPVHGTEIDLDSRPDSVTRPPLHHVVEVTRSKAPDTTTTTNIPKTTSFTPPCAGVTLYAMQSTAPSCRDQATGSIVLTGIKGGKPHYSFRLTDHKMDQLDSVFTELSSGYYQIELLDSQGCSTTLDEVYIDEKVCYTPEPGFNPDYEKWTYETQDNSRAFTISISDKSGVTLLSRSFSDVFEWDGVDMNGQRVPVGTYRYVIRNGDSQPKTGSISVIY